MQEFESHNETSMPITTTTYLSVIFKNLIWLIALAFYPMLDWIIMQIPQWETTLEHIKLIGGAVIVVLVIIKLLIEIIKLTITKKDK